MKKAYTSPAVEIAKFDCEDILSVSAVFTAFSAENDNEAAYKWSRN